MYIAPVMILSSNNFKCIYVIFFIFIQKEAEFQTLTKQSNELTESTKQLLDKINQIAGRVSHCAVWGVFVTRILSIGSFATQQVWHTN